MHPPSHPPSQTVTATAPMRGRRRRLDVTQGFDVVDEKRPKMEETDLEMNDTGLPPLSSFAYNPVCDASSEPSRPLTEDNSSQRGLAAHTRGAILFAVCRGKVSEGLDFANELCRLVVCVGIPYPPLRDVQIEQKKKFLSWKASIVQKAGLERSLTGEQWYSQQAFRALNQGIGRTIRHKNDWGSVVLLDERFCDKSTTKNLPRWLQPSLETANKSLSSAIRTQGRFFEHIENHPPGEIPDASKVCLCVCEFCRINCKRAIITTEV